MKTSSKFLFLSLSPLFVLPTLAENTKHDSNDDLTPSSGKKAAAWQPELKPTHVTTDLFSIPKDKNNELEVTVWATSPQIYNPTNMDVDHRGRMWVLEGVNYRRKGDRRPEGDRIMVLEDTTGDGKADKTTVFHQDKDLESPLGIAVFDNQIVVSQPPGLIIYTDVDRNRKFDPKVDKREVLLTGFNARQHDHSSIMVTVVEFSRINQVKNSFSMAAIKEVEANGT